MRRRCKGGRRVGCERAPHAWAAGPSSHPPPPPPPGAFPLRLLRCSRAGRAAPPAGPRGAPHTSRGSLSSSCGSCGQKSWDTTVAVRPPMSASCWRRRFSGVASLGTPCTWALMRLESARSCGAGQEKGGGQPARGCWLWSDVRVHQGWGSLWWAGCMSCGAPAPGASHAVRTASRAAAAADHTAKHLSRPFSPPHTLTAPP